MLGWFERVVPQPPLPHLTEETPPAPVQEPKPAKAPTGKAGGPGDAADHAHTKEVEKKVGFAVSEDPGSVFESVGSSVLSWISQGLEKVIPQPVPAPGTLQQLGKSFETSIDVPDQTEVQILKDEEEDALEITPFDQEDELDGYESEADLDTGEKEWAGARVLSWLAQGFERMVPQPEVLKKPEGLEKVMPQPVTREKQDAQYQVVSRPWHLTQLQSMPLEITCGSGCGNLDSCGRKGQRGLVPLKQMENEDRVHIVPGEPEETDLILEEITDEWINKATCEMMAWGREAELVTDACLLPPIQEEPQEEETRQEKGDAVDGQLCRLSGH
ncbi:hypothetical protein Q9966_000877 [Columba livia]|nr:hypothetical protein Q9966_000877 [Columba livia]